MNEETMVETVAAAVHAGWMTAKRTQGITSRRSETGEELMVPYDQLSEPAKDLDRETVVSVTEALRSLGFRITLPSLEEL